MTATAERPRQKSSVPIVPDAVVVKLGNECADLAEKGSDAIAAAYAGLMTLGLVSRNGRVVQAAQAIGTYLQVLVASQVADSALIETPAFVKEGLLPFATVTNAVIPRHIPPPTIEPNSFAAGFAAGRRSIELVEQSRKIRGRPVRRRRVKP